MLNALELNSLCAQLTRDGKPCPATELAQAGDIDLATFAEHRITAKAILTERQTRRNEVTARKAQRDMDRWRKRNRSAL